MIGCYASVGVIRVYQRLLTASADCCSGELTLLLHDEPA